MEATIQLTYPLFATLIGGIGGFLVVFAIVALDKLRIDDSVEAIASWAAPAGVAYLV